MAGFSDEEIEAAFAKHPGLARISPGEVQGELAVYAIYDGITVDDVFKVKITKPNLRSGRVPLLYEIGGRTQAAASKWQKDLAGAHCNPGGSACVCVTQEEETKFPPGSDLLFFIDNLARDYLYGLAQFEKTGQWPWGERSHGSLGVLEYYADHREPQSRTAIGEVIAMLRRAPDWKNYCRQLKRPSGDKRCLCGANRPFRQHHPEAWAGLLQLRSELDRLRIRPRSAFDQAISRRSGS